MSELTADASLATNNRRVYARERMLPLMRARFAHMSKAELMDACERAIPLPGLGYTAVMIDCLMREGVIGSTGGVPERRAPIQ